MSKRTLDSLSVFGERLTYNPAVSRRTRALSRLWCFIVVAFGLVLLPPFASQTRVAHASSFTDTQTSDTEIYYIADRGWMTGYGTAPPCSSAPCFKPNDLVSRAQFAKVLANAKSTEGWQLQNPAVATFDDVAKGSEFYIYVETVNFYYVARGYSGDPNYFNPCIGRNETSGRTYFRPCLSVSRAQTAKMVVGAMRMFKAWITPSTPTFSDVPTSNSFYTYVETAYSHQVMLAVTGTSFQLNTNMTRRDVAITIFRSMLLRIDYSPTIYPGYYPAGREDMHAFPGTPNYNCTSSSSGCAANQTCSTGSPTFLPGSLAGYNKTYSTYIQYEVVPLEIQFTQSAKDWIVCSKDSGWLWHLEYWTDLTSPYTSYRTNLPDVTQPHDTVTWVVNRPDLLEVNQAKYFLDMRVSMGISNSGQQDHLSFHAAVAYGPYTQVRSYMASLCAGNGFDVSPMNFGVTACHGY
ncbi:MAG TPA: S-layer homology domain-containing protein [Chloroflexia bacterium]